MVKERVKKIIAETLEIPVTSIDDNASQKTLENWNSLRHLNLIVALEDEFNLSFEPEQIGIMVSVDAIVNEINKMAS